MVSFCAFDVFFNSVILGSEYLTSQLLTSVEQVPTVLAQNCHVWFQLVRPELELGLSFIVGAKRQSPICTRAMALLSSVVSMILIM